MPPQTTTGRVAGPASMCDIARGRLDQAASGLDLNSKTDLLRFRSRFAASHSGTRRSYLLEQAEALGCVLGRFQRQDHDTLIELMLDLYLTRLRT